MLFLWATAILGGHVLAVVCAALETALWLAYVGWGAVNAQRARSYGCW